MAALVEEERALAEQEQEIIQGLAQTRDGKRRVGVALLRIRESRLYRGAGYASWATYLQRRWPWLPRYTAWRWMKEAGRAEAPADGQQRAPVLYQTAAALSGPVPAISTWVARPPVQLRIDLRGAPDRLTESLVACAERLDAVQAIAPDLEEPRLRALAGHYVAEAAVSLEYVLIGLEGQGFTRSEA